MGFGGCGTDRSAGARQASRQNLPLAWRTEDAGTPEVKCVLHSKDEERAGRW